MTNTANSINAQTLSQVLAEMNTLGTANSIQFAYARLQLAQSQICQNSAKNYMDQIEQIQELQAQIADMVSQARNLQNEADASGKYTEMPKEMIEFFEQHGLTWNEKGNDYRHDKDQWTENIKSLTNYQETVGNKTQTLMVYLQNFIGQYNSYLEGANAAVSAGIQTLTAVARGQ